MTSEAPSAILAAALARCVGVQMFGGASTRYLQDTLAQNTVQNCTRMLSRRSAILAQLYWQRMMSGVLLPKPMKVPMMLQCVIVNCIA